nr:Dihydrofolate reductase [uncultured bacterium]
MMLSLIVAASENNVIGLDNDIPWRLPDDWKHFKDTTLGCPVIMGRKTHESIGRVLPGRRNIVVSRQKELKIEGCDVVASIQDALALAKTDAPREIFVIGGEGIFREALPLADRIYLTRVHATVEGDVFFPELNLKEWKEISRERHLADDHHPYAFDILILDRQK